MSDHRTDIQTALQHHGHFVPRFVHFTAVDAMNRQHVENHDVPVDGDIFRRNPQHGNLAAVSHVGEHAAKGRRISGHLQANVKPFHHSEFSSDIFQLFRGHIYRASHSQISSQLQSPWIHIGYHNEPRSRMTDDSGSHQSDGASPCNQHVLAQHWKGQSRVNRVTEGIED